MRPGSWLWALFATLLWSSLPTASALAQSGAQTATPVDLELVLAVDVSRSMDPDEQELQRAGYVAAFRDREVLRAIRSGPVGGIAVSYVEWAGTGLQRVVLLVMQELCFQVDHLDCDDFPRVLVKSTMDNAS